MLPLMSTRSGRQVKPTPKMAELMNTKYKDIQVEQLILENSILKTQLEISETEERLRRMTMNRSNAHTNDRSVRTRNTNDGVRINEPHETPNAINGNANIHAGPIHQSTPTYASISNVMPNVTSNAIPPAATMVIAASAATTPTPSLTNAGITQQIDAPSYVPDNATSTAAMQHVATPDPPATPQVAPSQATSSAEDLTAHASNVNHIADMCTRMNLPKLEPEIFSGNVIDFPLWVKSFEALIERNTMSPSERLYFLSKYTAGEAKETIKGYFMEGSIDAYDDAKKHLQTRYGDKYHAAETFKDKLHNWPVVKTGDGKALRKLADFMWQCSSAMSSLQHLSSLNSADENKRILAKLPQFIRDRWCRMVDRHLYGENSTGEYPSFGVFCKFIDDEARVANGPSANIRNVTQSHSNTGFKPRNNAVVHRNEAEIKVETKCTLCSGAHSVADCDQYKLLELNERRNHAAANGLCFGCLKVGHIKRHCRRRGKPLIYVGLTPTPARSTDSSAPTPSTREGDSAHEASAHRTTVKNSEPKMNQVYTPVVKVTVHHPDQPNRKVDTYAMLDSQSNSCFITKSLADELNAPQIPVSLKLTTLLKKQIVNSSIMKGLIINGAQQNTDLKLPNTYTRESIPGSDQLIPNQEFLQQWSHLNDIAQEIHYDDALKVGLLIGANCSAALLPKEIRAGRDCEPFAIRTNLGWGVTGGQKERVDMPRLTFRTQVQEVLPEEVHRMFQYEFCEKAEESDEKISFEDRKFIDVATKGIQQKADGHYQLPLPFKNGEPILPNNRIMAEKRLTGLIKKMSKSKDYKDDYEKFMNKMLTSGYAEKAPSTPTNGKVWYIPHHGVYNPRKPGKIRIVFDSSAEFKGEILNNHLMTAPDLTNNLAGVLCRFRKEPIALACDIEGMFNQVSVPEEQRDYLRFLWLENDTIQEYRMTVHLFGAASSPGCVNFALKTAANEYEDEYGKSTADFIREDFYVDDGLTSVATVDEAKQMIENSRQLCKRAGFNLHKFACSNKEVMESVPQERRDKEFQAIDLSHDSLPVARTLGVEWCTEEDMFKITYNKSVKKEGSAITRRSILSSISSLFDPLGLISPVLLSGRLILREVCKDGRSWDEAVGNEKENEWKTWIDNLEELNDLKVNRCYKTGLTDVESVEMHHFSDASLQGYGQCSYIRLSNSTGSISTSLVMSKSRITPSKPVTIPRLELMAAVLSVKVATFLDKEMHYSNMKHVFWCDSKVVLGYIKNESRRFHMFVSNRVQQIRRFTEPNQWNYVETKENPADLTSRGVKTCDLAKSDLWWHGPDFLLQNLPLPRDEDNHIVDEDDPEVRKIQALNTEAETVVEFDLIDRLRRFSSWQSAKSAVALCLRLQRKYRKTESKIANVNGPPNVDELEQAERVIIKEVQRREFNEEIKILQSMRSSCSPPKGTRGEVKTRKKEVKNKTKHSLHKLDPFLDEYGILRVGGRQQHDSQSHQILLPKKNHITDLVARHFHETTLHAGRSRTLHEIRRQGFWILRARNKVSSLLKSCVPCKRLRGKVNVQKMADLPVDRTTEAPPFTYSGVDLFGPFYVREGRSDKKRWGVLFTCMATRAVHIEVVHSLTTDSFLNAYRRFVCRRGPIRTLRSDRGTNFVGAKNELEVGLRELDADAIKRKLARDKCDFVDFKFNVPHASHMGGCWERMIQTTRNALSAILMKQPGLLDDEGLETFMIEAEAVVNSRPLTLIGDVEDGESLSPMQLLTLKSAVVLPLPGVFCREDIYSKKRWRRVQYLAEQFWSKWKREFLPSLQERSKWTKDHPDLEVNDIVIVLDDTVPRNKWPLGKIVETFPSEDGRVRKVKVKTKDTQLDRPIQKLILLLKPGIPDKEPY